jgi:hypothetical protein
LIREEGFLNKEFIILLFFWPKLIIRIL